MVNGQEAVRTKPNYLQNILQKFSRHSYKKSRKQRENSSLSGSTLTNGNIKKISFKDVYSIIQKDLNAKKARGYDLITGKILKELPDKALRLIIIIYNAVLRLNYYPAQWKIAQIILLSKPEKNLEEVILYRPISLLPVISKVFEKLLLKRIKPELEKDKTIPDHQFGFREQHSTIEKVHRIVRKINNNLEKKRYCSAVF